MKYLFSDLSELQIDQVVNDDVMPSCQTLKICTGKQLHILPSFIT